MDREDANKVMKKLSESEFLCESDYILTVNGYVITTKENYNWLKKIAYSSAQETNKIVAETRSNWRDKLEKVAKILTDRCESGAQFYVGEARFATVDDSITTILGRIPGETPFPAITKREQENILISKNNEEVEDAVNNIIKRMELYSGKVEWENGRFLTSKE